MRVVDYLVSVLEKKGVTDAFGIPGGVILDFLYALMKSKVITPHLSYHEQGASFEALGYAQINHTLGVAYATKGPGFTNLITGIADAYSDSVPIIFITAHEKYATKCTCRFECNQELDTVQMVKGITKYASFVDDEKKAASIINEACDVALCGRKGPVLLDFSAAIWNKEIETFGKPVKRTVPMTTISPSISKMLLESERPLFLVGDGLSRDSFLDRLVDFSNKYRIPVVSSRGALDIGKRFNYYFGYIGSHGVRYANFIFYKSDLTVCFGNSLSFPTDSASYKDALNNKKTIYVDIDENELSKEICNSIKLLCDINDFIEYICNIDYSSKKNWLDECFSIKSMLFNCDLNETIHNIESILTRLQKEVTIVSDVGNNEFWVSRAYERLRITNRLLFSKSFGVVGCGLPKAIGAYYKTKQPVLCFVGDQGIQLNVQELQMVSSNSLPIIICVINNKMLGMILDREIAKNNHPFHTTIESGYSNLSLKSLACLYGIDYLQYNPSEFPKSLNYPIILEMNVDEYLPLAPSLPKGNKIYIMDPPLDESTINELEGLYCVEKL